MLALKSCISCLSCHQFEVDLSPPAEVVELFKKYSHNESHMTESQLQKFLAEVQCESIPDMESKVQNFVDKAFNLKQKIMQPAPLFSLDDFFRYLFNENLNPPIHGEVHHDMTLPMSHYYIFTGHNSYITGNQFSSKCSVQPIIDALKNGVRVIELDLWPNSRKDGIHVKHGGTLTPPVDFKECIRALKDHAFVKSKYPVIITFEDHLTSSLQAKAAKIVHQVLGKVLYCPSHSYEGLEEFPSPESLMEKIIISTKPPEQYLERAQNVKVSLSTQVEQENLLVSDETAENPDNEQEDSSVTFSGPLDSYNEGINSPEVEPPEYRNMIAIRAGKPPRVSLKDALAPEPHVKRVSLSEAELSRIAKSHPDTVVGFTRKNLLRIYPKGIRVNSSNYCPMDALSHGAQMVAFNMQGYGKPLWLLHGLFRANGGSGYIKKPDFLIDQQAFNPMQPGQVKQTLKVKIYQGKGWLGKFKRTHFDSYTPPDFYVKVGIAGVKADNVMKRTQTIIDNWTPHWDEEFEFPLRVPELALLSIEVLDRDQGKDDFGGQTCLPVSELKPGIRAVPLYDTDGSSLHPVQLLMRFDFK